MAERIAKKIAKLGYCSRRQAEELITKGKVKVNGKVINTPVFFVEEQDIIEIGNEKLSQPESTKVFMYYKPTGYVCSNSDEKGRKTIFDNLPPDLPRLIYVGRLDINSEGLLLLTTSGALAHALTNPKLALNRTYKVRVFGEVKQTDLENLALGITINGIRYKPIIADITHHQGSNTWLEITITEGKNREIRNICEYLGLQVNRLIRTSFGSYNLKQTPLYEGEIVEVPPHGLKKYLSKELFQELFPKDYKLTKPQQANRTTSPTKFTKSVKNTKATRFATNTKFSNPTNSTNSTKPARVTKYNKTAKLPESDSLTKSTKANASHKTVKPKNLAKTSKTFQNSKTFRTTKKLKG